LKIEPSIPVAAISEKPAKTNYFGMKICPGCRKSRSDMQFKDANICRTCQLRGVKV
jgi:hypothetical protein